MERSRTFPDNTRSISELFPVKIEGQTHLYDATNGKFFHYQARPAANRLATWFGRPTTRLVESTQLTPTIIKLDRANTTQPRVDHVAIRWGRKLFALARVSRPNTKIALTTVLVAQHDGNRLQPKINTFVTKPLSVRDEEGNAIPEKVRVFKSGNGPLLHSFAFGTRGQHVLKPIPKSWFTRRNAASPSRTAPTVARVGISRWVHRVTGFLGSSTSTRK